MAQLDMLAEVALKRSIDHTSENQEPEVLTKKSKLQKEVTDAVDATYASIKAMEDAFNAMKRATLTSCENLKKVNTDNRIFQSTIVEKKKTSDDKENLEGQKRELRELEKYGHQQFEELKVIEINLKTVELNQKKKELVLKKKELELKQREED